MAHKSGYGRRPAKRGVGLLPRKARAPLRRAQPMGAKRLTAPKRRAS